MDTDVLIVGAGPTGLMLANQLVRRGVRTLIIDRHSGPACFLLRPDGHIRLAGGRLDADAVNRYIVKCHMRLESKGPSAAGLNLRAA
jgi:2-polyprenyl-6-methoxyphenol hydroxylase-like FAD-dependent oxidoreductase